MGGGDLSSGHVPPSRTAAGIPGRSFILFAILIAVLAWGCDGSNPDAKSYAFQLG
jgi:hypothetical protein